VKHPEVNCTKVNCTKLRGPVEQTAFFFRAEFRTRRVLVPHSGRACRVLPAPARYSRLLLCARARVALLPVRYSCPLAFPTRLLLLLASLIAPFVARYPFVAKYEDARYPYVANHEHPPGMGTIRGASTPGHGHYPGCDPGLPLCCSCPYPPMCSYPCLCYPRPADGQHVDTFSPFPRGVVYGSSP